ncbi:YjeF N-terminal domain-like protein [Protomyces lactucae-debilis]|uniref:NAD(P)H-hydrate epimerase n=1 Tax=Protomyces lactucae-debilis TaxID=2754530 RepID=A0A1Y2EZU3_PROLT|nr:YjeF N-terminal domain-like protein [Protomyces lactucae-debilis]ORY76977.1 YjeF N-terminal domain-like protein [Protomyces lactucae-debilis]
MQYLSAKDAAALDDLLMSPETGFELAQLMELAGLSVAQAAHKMLQEREKGKPAAANAQNRVLIICGPGNNGGDGLVAARHLQQLSHDVQIWYPKPKKGIYEGLVKQLNYLKIPVSNSSNQSPQPLRQYDLIVDAIFGFSFSGEVRSPFDAIIQDLSQLPRSVPVLSVDAPSSWHIDDGRPSSGPGRDFCPAALISLSAPKRLAAHFQGRQFLGGRFLGPELQAAYGLPAYPGTDHVVELPKL